MEHFCQKSSIVDFRPGSKHACVNNIHKHLTWAPTGKEIFFIVNIRVVLKLINISKTNIVESKFLDTVNISQEQTQEFENT